MGNGKHTSTNSPKSTYQEKVDAARDRDASRGAAPESPDADAVSLAELPGAQSFVRKASSSRMNEMAAKGEVELAPILITMEPGDEITCEVISEEDIMVDSLQVPGVKVPAKAYTLRLFHPDTGENGPLVSIFGNAQLVRQLPPLLGCDVIIARGETHKHKGNKQLSDFAVARFVRPRTERRMLNAGIHPAK